MPRVQLQIPQACSQSWEAMTPTDRGRHCVACQQVVTDFSYRTDAEVLALLRDAAGGRLCGRFRPEQLERALIPPAASPWRAWLLAATLWTGRALAPVAAQDFRNHSGSPVPAGSAADYQSSPPATPAADAAADKPGAILPVPAGLLVAPVAADPVAASGPVRIRGRVVDHDTQEPLPGTAVVVAGTNTGVATAADGTFELTVPSPGVTLDVVAVGYQRATVSCIRPGSAACVALKADTTQLTGEVVIIRVVPWYSPRRWWSWLRSVPQRLASR